MHIHDLDLNLLRLLEAVHRLGSVSRAALELGITQPAASQGLTRLRLKLGDALFVRAPGGVAPTPRAQRLSVSVREALAGLQEALAQSQAFDAATSRRLFRLHLSDIGEARFLPELMALLHRRAPQVRLESQALAHADISGALAGGQIDLALGFLPSVRDTRSQPLLTDRYIVLLRAGHPFAKGLDGAGRGRRKPVQVKAQDLRQLEFAAVRTHAETLRILRLLRLEDRLRLTADHFLALPDIVRGTDLGVLMPRNIAQGFAADGRCVIVEPRMPLSDFTVSMHWSRRHEADPANVWLRGQVGGLFGELG